jgi:hypothetical protein
MFMSAKGSMFKPPSNKISRAEIYSHLLAFPERGHSLSAAGPQLQTVRGLVVGRRPIGDAATSHPGQQGILDKNHAGLSTNSARPRAPPQPARIYRASGQSALRQPPKVLAYKPAHPPPLPPPRPTRYFLGILIAILAQNFPRPSFFHSSA